MTPTFDVSNKLPDDVVAVLRRLDAVLRNDETQYVLVGALARDAVTSHLQGVPPTRATKDIDLAVRVTSMAAFEAVTRPLPRKPKHAHTFVVDGIEIDIVPFGDVAGPDGVRFRDSLFDPTGLAEAADTCAYVRVGGDLTVPVASVVALCVLKTLAWRDRRGHTGKDADDLAHLFAAVDAPPYAAEVEEAARELVEYDGSLEGAAWLGREGARLAAPATWHAVVQVLTDHAPELAQDMGGPLAAERLQAYLDGLLDCPPAGTPHPLP